MMGLYWVTEAIPIAATSLFPLFWFPFLGIMSSKTVCGLYFSDTICLFIATNIVGLAMEKYRFFVCISFLVPVKQLFLGL